MLDHDAVLFTITDLKQYIYCARIFYYHACVPGIRPTTYKMQAGIAAHTAEPKRAARRTFRQYGEPDGEREFEVALQSPALSLSGRIDEVVNTGQELIPVDYKLARKAAYHFKVQLTAYALLLEEAHAAVVKRGYLYLIQSRETVEVPISTKLRSHVRRALAAMHEIRATEHMPSATDWRQRCADCEFRRFCNDV